VVEAAAVIDPEGAVLAWHLPPGRTAVSLPDSRSLWSTLWAHRDRLGGLAHTHPGTGRPVPSREDLTTFAACEAGLGLRLDWWIATADQVLRFRWCGPGRTDYVSQEPLGPTTWLERLRQLSLQEDTDVPQH